MWFKKLEQPGEMRQFEIHSAKFLFRKHGQQVEQELIILLKFLLYSYFCIINPHLV